MRRHELDLAADWAAAEGWNPGLRDAEAFWLADPEGFWLAELSGKPIACISVVRHGPEFGFLGFYIVQPAFRGQGHGLALWNAGLHHLGTRCVGLDGVVAQQANYRRYGFDLAWRNIRFGSATPAPPDMPRGVQVLAAAEVPFAAIEAFDRACFGAPRAAFLRAWLATPGHVALAVVRDGVLAGYAVLRPCREGSKVGPLFAADEPAARALLASVLARAPGGPVFLDVPETNAAAVALAQQAGMAPVFETARMYRGRPPEVVAARIFGITTFELG